MPFRSGLEESQDSPAVSTVAPLKKKDGPILTGETGRGDSLSRSESSGSVSDSGSGSDDELGNILKELDVVMAKKFGDKAANLTDLTAAVKEAFDEFDTDKIGFLNRCCPPPQVSSEVYLKGRMESHALRVQDQAHRL